jgi:hypothetical protein
LAQSPSTIRTGCTATTSSSFTSWPTWPCGAFSCSTRTASSPTRTSSRGR